jgi:threonine dehydrogenase-like Zn-dependent dehydrogenase
MKQVIVHAPYDVRFDDVPSENRALGPYELRVQTELSALSPGTETRIYTGLEQERFAYRVQYPMAIGYNNVGRVIEIGDKVRDYRVGQRIFSRMPHQSEIIVTEKNMNDPGRPRSSNVPMSYDVIAPLPENVKSEHAAFTHLFVLGFNALQRAEYRFGENVVVIGLGIVGLGAVCMAHLAGARVAAIGNDGSRLEIARAMGADEAWLNGDEDTTRAKNFGGEAGIDVVIVCADAWDALKTAVDLARRNTRISVLAFPGVGQGAPPFDPFAPADFYNKSISYISTSWMPSDDYPPEYQRFTVKRIYRYILDRMACGHIDLSPVVTHHFPIARIKQAFDLVLSKDKAAIGIVLDWTDDGRRTTNDERRTMKDE